MITRYDFDSVTAQTYTATERDRIGALIEEHGDGYKSLADLITDYSDDIYADSLESLSERHAEAHDAARAATAALCEAVIAAYRTGTPKATLARRAGVSRPTVDKWLA